MGCDGGTIPRRDELVRTKKKPEQKDKNAENVAKWKHCAITQEPLRKPIVSCELGKLYNKEAVIEHILNKDKAASNMVASHISKMSEVKELNLTEKSGFEANKEHKGDEYVDFNESRYICPVTGLDMNGRQKFFLIWSCGCVVSERALKEVKSDTCHKCGKAFVESDTIVLNGSEEEMKILETKMIDRRRLAKLEKKKKRAAAPATATSEEKKIKTEPQPSTSNGHVKESVAKVNGVDLPEKAKKSYSIAKDPKATAAYKSLFTTHEKAQNQQKAHWVTHNPLYF